MLLVRGRCVSALSRADHSRQSSQVSRPSIRAPRTAAAPLHQRRQPCVLRRAGEVEPPSAASTQAVLPYELPDTIKEAIEVGNGFAKQQEWSTALEVYEKSMSLAGSATKRFRDKPPGITDGEKAAALINVACCHARMGNTRAGLVAIVSAMEAGYEGFSQLRTDPDLEALRSDPRFEGLMARFEPKPATGLLGGLKKIMGGF